MWRVVNRRTKSDPEWGCSYLHRYYVFQLSTINGHILRNLVNETSLRGFPYPMRPGKELDVWEKGM
jgi:hypothetical protein